jgi:hypothetical protein
MMETQTCPNCNYSLNPTIGIEGETHDPLPTDFAVCIHCASLLKFDSALKLTMTDRAEIKAMALQEPTNYRKIAIAQNRIAIGNGQPYPPSV